MMKRETSNRNSRRALAVGAALTALLPGCNVVDRVNDIGAPPALSLIENPVTRSDYRPVTLPMPRPEPAVRQANSLWRSGARAFFKDQRAARIGDILTVDITIEDEARIDNATTRTRAGSEDADVTALLGFEGTLAMVLPEGFSPSQAASLGSNSSHAGSGSVNRKETIKLKVAAIVSQVLPNGNMVITGSQEVRVNFEMRMLTITGVVRPEDISAVNTISHSQIAEARIAYGGRGQITDVQQPRYGQQLFDIIFPL